MAEEPLEGPARRLLPDQTHKSLIAYMDVLSVLCGDGSMCQRQPRLSHDMEGGQSAWSPQF
jgi:hypothetical protein